VEKESGRGICGCVFPQPICLVFFFGLGKVEELSAEDLAERV